MAPITEVSKRYASKSPVTSIKDEKIGVAKIKVRHVQEQLTAVLAEFAEVDKLLLDWVTRAGENIECEFEVVFLDGYGFTGTCEACHKKTSRPSLRTFIRNFLYPPIPRYKVGMVKETIRKIIDIYGDDIDPSVLDQYEICVPQKGN